MRQIYTEKNVSGCKTEKSSFFERKNRIFFLYL